MASRAEHYQAAEKILRDLDPEYPGDDLIPVLRALTRAVLANAPRPAS